MVNISQNIFFALSVIFAVFLIGCSSADSEMALISQGINTSNNNSSDPLIENCAIDEVIIDGVCRYHDSKNSNIYGPIDFSLLTTQDTEYGYLVKPKEGIYPGVIMIHEWWGLNGHIKSMAHQLAAQGYVVLALDLYGNVTNNSQIARELSSTARENQFYTNEKMVLASSYLQNTGYINSIASLGWGFGGEQTLQLSISDYMDATVIYYGNLITDENLLRAINGPVLGIFGQNDTVVPLESISKFEDSLNKLSMQKDIHIYENVSHAFMNPNGERFSLETSILSWEKTLDFLNRELKENR